LWLHSLKVAQLLRSAACLHTNQSRSYLNHLVHGASLTNKLTTWSKVLERVVVHHLDKKFPKCCGNRKYSEQPASWPYLEPDESRPRHPIHCLSDAA